MIGCFLNSNIVTGLVILRFTLLVTSSLCLILCPHLYNIYKKKNLYLYLCYSRLREHGATALGPAALISVAMASQFAGSKVSFQSVLILPIILPYWKKNTTNNTLMSHVVSEGWSLLYHPDKRKTQVGGEVEFSILEKVV